MAHDDLVDQLRTIEESLRDRALDALRSTMDGQDASFDEKRLTKARRAVAKAIEALDDRRISE